MASFTSPEHLPDRTTATHRQLTLLLPQYIRSVHNSARSKPTLQTHIIFVIQGLAACDIIQLPFAQFSELILSHMLQGHSEYDIPTYEDFILSRLVSVHFSCGEPVIYLSRECQSTIWQPLNRYIGLMVRWRKTSVIVARLRISNDSICRMAPAYSYIDRHSRRRPFSSWMKRLANLKSSSSDSAPTGTGKRSQQTQFQKTKKENPMKNNPYPSSGKPNINASIPNSGHGHLSFYTPPSGRSLSNASQSQSKLSLPGSSDEHQAPTISNKSAAPTVSTNPDTVTSDTAASKAGTTATAGGALSSNGRGGGEGSTFSSPAPSVRSLTTTLTTIQSSAPSNLLVGNQTQPAMQPAVSPSAQQSQNYSTHFTHQFPSSPPASAIPSHVVNQTSGGGHPATYSTATANNLLTDNASIMTLASSSKRRRRNSLDTNASVRALAPSSLFGGSRESLPLSVLSANVGDQPGNTSLHQARHPSTTLPSTERASVYSSSGIAPALSSERNSYYAGKQSNTGDGGSMRSGLLGHGRNDSITGSIGGHGNTGSPLASPREVPSQGRISRRNSGWGEVNEEDISSDEEDTGSEKKDT